MTDHALKIAIATNDMENLNAHFGSARSFAVYEVSATASRFVEAVGFDDVTAQTARHDDEADRIGPKIAALNGCALLFVLAIGGPSAARVVRAGVHPIKRKDPEPISAILTQVRDMLRDGPPPFLRKAMGRSAAPSFLDPSFLDEEISQ
ncbi:nitrogen fixation protein NifX [Paracoccaceae bacterium Fryx2]|nr:nitrogen fixation protein NifX [Paracoccaceae bacterium Fryx2]